MKELAAFIITFHRPHCVREYILSLLGQTLVPETILVLDNGSDEQTRAVVLSFQREGAPVRYVGLGDNMGPAGAANVGLDRLVGDGYTWILWGDDDNPPGSKTALEELVTLPGRYHNPASVGAVGLTGGRFNWRTGRLSNLVEADLKGIVEVDVVGGGWQLLVHRRAVESVGLPAAELFFGFEEGEYCLRIRKAGFSILVDGDDLRRRREEMGKLGLPARYRDPRKAGDATRLWRSYYSTRNYTYMMAHTYHRTDLVLREMGRAIARSAFALRHGPGYSRRVLAAQTRGLWDGCWGRMGRTQESVTKSHC